MEGVTRYELKNTVLSTDSQSVPLEMYTLPNQSTPISEHSLKRYINCHDQNELIDGFLEKKDRIFNFEESIREVPDSEKGSLIEKALAGDDIDIQVRAAKLIFRAPKLEQFDLKKKVKTSIERSFEGDNLEVKLKAVEMIWYTPQSEQDNLLKTIKPLIETALNGDNFRAQIIATGLIHDIPEPERVPLIRKALENNNVEIQNKAVEMIMSAPQSERGLLIQKALNSKNITVQKNAVELIRFVPKFEQEFLIDRVFESGNTEIQIKMAEIIANYLGSKKDGFRQKTKLLIEKVFENGDIKVQKKTAEMIWFAPESEQDGLRKKVQLLIEKAFESGDIEAQKDAVEMIKFAPESEQRRLIENALKTENIEIQGKAVEMIFFAPESEQQSLFESFSMRRLIDVLIDPPLYKKKDISDIYPERQAFDKTGSGTTLIGGQLKGKSIIRHITPEAFLSWQKIYENYEVWKEDGFDYVPIEPIQAYYFDKNKDLVNVFSGVLDRSLDSWKTMSSLFSEELEAQRQKITEVLELQGVAHGHLHDSNFVLSFFRNGDGSVNLNKTPRLYAIDFDQAISVPILKAAKR